ncbi:uncharacterized protein LOC123272252 [Cotesia glomerata]|uniref:uncharacterized protein LOC123272252 n=1 Tax=Cotesia glomerata TaxID=32391 RepID=UPI001D01B701|nr:uncharacterized protein LOC123272252 [Cotesia glomerata]
MLIALSRKNTDKGQTLRKTIADILKEVARVTCKGPQEVIVIRDVDDDTTKDDIQGALQKEAGDGCEIPLEAIKIHDNNWVDAETQSVEDHCVFDSTPQKTTRSITSQTDEIVDESVLGEHKYFFCNINSCDGVCTAEVQVNILIKRTAEKICGINLPPLRKNVEDVGCDPITSDSIKSDCQGFHGITSIHDDQSLSSLTGVNFSIFTFLLNMLPDIKSTKIDKKTKLLITLTKLKTGLTFTALGVLFSIHKTSAQKIFISNLQQLNILLKNFIVWPSRATIQATLPEAFKKNYPATRVIIDCTEVYTEQPPEVRQKVLMYSDYKHHQTVKFLVGCAPNGLITFVSKCYGGRSSDCYITNDCGIVDLIESGDVVLADKGFPQIKTEVEKKNAVFIMPPFAHGGQFTAEEVDETYNIASMKLFL